MQIMNLYNFLLIFLRFLIHFQFVSLNDQINVGTVLFEKKDTDKKCWNDDQISLLRARLIYQDILPKTTLVDVKNDEFLNALIKYFHLAINKVKRLADGPTQQINLTAMCDVLGGYFRSILIPLTKRAFYSGTINYETTKNVLKFYDNIKLFLHTDGKNWAPPGDVILNRFTRECLNEKNNSSGSCEKLTYGNNNGFIYIPTPYFDSKTAPSAIAIPFKDNPLRNMEHKNAINCLLNFYSTAKRCLEEQHASRENKNAFNRDFEKFLDAEVFPHLNDEKVYPAFGGVFRIKNEINRKNVAKRKDRIITKKHLNQTKVARMVDLDKNKDVDAVSDDFGSNLQDDDDKAPIIVLVCLCVVTALWLCITLYYCVKNRKKKLPKAIMTDDESIKNPESSVKITEERRRSSITTSNATKTSKENTSKNEAKKIAFVETDTDREKRQKCQVCARTSQHSSADFCPKCKKKHCRCIKNIWSTLSKYTISYPRIFPKKNPQMSKKIKETRDHFPNKSEHSPAAQTHFLVQMASVIPKPPARSIKSAPVTVGKNIWQSENTSRVASTAVKPERRTDEKIFVFGYDFETSSSDDSSFTDESSSDTI